MCPLYGIYLYMHVQVNYVRILAFFEDVFSIEIFKKRLGRTKNVSITYVCRIRNSVAKTKHVDKMVVHYRIIFFNIFINSNLYIFFSFVVAC